MDSALIVSCMENDTAFLTELLSAASIHHITSLKSVDNAQRFILQEDFDLVIVNAPLRDESGENFSRNLASKGASQVILLVKTE